MHGKMVIEHSMRIPARRSRGLLEPGLCLLVLIAAGTLRFAFARYSLWFDEFASVFFASQPTSRLWSLWMVRETNPPLYYSLLHVWSAAFGVGVVSLRSLSIVASLGAMIVTYQGISGSNGRRAAVIAVLMMAVSAQHLYFAQQVRGYMLLYLAVTISFFGLMRIARSADSGGAGPTGAWCAYVLGAIAAVYCHTTAMLWPAAGTLALMIASPAFRPARTRSFGVLVVADAVVLMAAAWWIAITYLQTRVPNGNLGWIPHASVRTMIWTLRATILLTRDTSGWQQIAPLAVGALALWGTVRTWRAATTRLAVGCLLISAALFIAASRIQPVLIDRTVFWLSIFPLTLAAVGIDRSGHRIVPITIAGALLLLLGIDLVQFAPTLQHEDWITPVERVAHAPNGVMLVDGEAMTVAVQMACAVELHADHCPFPVVAVLGNSPDYDPWAVGYATPASLPLLREMTSGKAVGFLFRCGSQDVLYDVHGSGLLGRIASTGPRFIGPLPAAFLPDLLRRSRIDDGLLRLDHGPVNAR